MALRINSFTDAYDSNDPNSDFAKELFDQYDKDRDGYLDTSEVEVMLKDAYKAMGEFIIPKEKDIEDYIKVLDKDQDGKVSLNDFVKLSKHYFAGVTTGTTYVSYNGVSNRSTNVTNYYKEVDSKATTTGPTPNSETSKSYMFNATDRTSNLYTNFNRGYY